MYGKIFKSIFDSTLSECWQATVVFMAMVTLSNKDGVVDMTREALIRRTNYPPEVVDVGLEYLMQPDPSSRSQECEGRRIILVDPERRNWGWQVVNYKYYCGLASTEDRRTKERERMREKRRKNKDVAECCNPLQPVANVAHIDVDINRDIYTEESNDSSCPAPPLPEDARPDQVKKPKKKTDQLRPPGVSQKYWELIAPAFNGEKAVVKVWLPCRRGSVKALDKFPVTSGLVSYYQDLFGKMNFRSEFMKMLSWLDADTSRQKTFRGMPRFISGWLTRAMQRSGE